MHPQRVSNTSGSPQETELQRELGELRARLREVEHAARSLEAQVRERDEALRWILSSRVFRFSRGLCTTLDLFLAPLRRRRLQDAAGPWQPGENGTSPAAPLETDSSAPEVSPAVPVQLRPELRPAQRPDVICLPIIDWEFRFQRPQHLLRELARARHRVFYVRNRFHEGRSPGGHDGVELDAILTDITGVTLPGPQGLSVYSSRLDAALLQRFVRAFDLLRRQEGIHDAVVIVDLPFWEPLAQELRRRFGWRLVYDCMDEHAGFSTNAADMLQCEHSLLRSSDLVLTTARVLTEKALAVNDAVLVLPNACEYEHFARAEPHEYYESLAGRVVVGYYGAIHDWFDAELVAEVARARPDWHFVLIGCTSGRRIACLEELENIHLLGEIPYAELPSWLHGFDVACIPFVDNELTRATNPVKFYEYLSAGKPVVSTPLYELEPYADHFYAARDVASFVAAIERALREDGPERARARRTLARAHTWQARGHELERSLRQLYGRAAIVIVSYRDIDVLRQCLESIWANTTYADYEVIVVDNDSGPELREYLESQARGEPRLRLHFNAENRGFSAANNQGIALASDAEYIVLLNHDTIVTRGWLGRLLRYLQNPTIGLVGPVTSWAGNEARIPVSYSVPDGIAEFAHRQWARHAELHFDIDVLAMFCVAMRRDLLGTIGLLDERYGIGMFEDDDFALRVRDAGLRTICAEDVFVHHYGEQSFKKLERPEYEALFAANRQAFEAKWQQPWRPHAYRDWDLEAGVPGHYASFTMDAWVWVCPFCAMRHRDVLLRSETPECSGCGASGEARAAARALMLVHCGRPLPLHERRDVDAIAIEGLPRVESTVRSGSPNGRSRLLLHADPHNELLRRPDRFGQFAARVQPGGLLALASRGIRAEPQRAHDELHAAGFTPVPVLAGAFPTFGIRFEESECVIVARRSANPS